MMVAGRGYPFSRPAPSPPDGSTVPKPAKFGLKEARRQAELIDGIRENTSENHRWRIESEKINKDFINGVLSTPTARLMALNRLEFIWAELQAAREHQLSFQVDPPEDDEPIPPQDY